MRKILLYLQPYWKHALIAPLLMILEVAMDLMQPRMMQRIMDEGIRLGNQPLVLQTGAIMIVFALIGAVGGIGCTYFAVYASINFGADVRKSLYRKIQALSFGNLDKLGTGQLVTLLTNDVTQVQDAVLIVLRILVRAPLIAVGSLIMAFLVSPQLALIAIPAMLPLILLLIVMIRVAHPMYLRVQRSLDRVNTVIQENLAGVRVVKAFVREDHEKQRFGAANATLTSDTIRAMTLTSLTAPAVLLLLNLGIAGIVWLSGSYVQQGTMKVGEVVAVITYFTQALSTLVMVSMLLIRLSRAQASIERIVTVLDSQPDIQDRPDALTKFHPQGRVVFDNVSFGYGEPVLKNISFVAEPGQTVAILGATGSGKTSLIHLIARFYDVDAGKITIDGVNIRDVSQAALRENIGISLQEAVLFSGTIADNIRYGRANATSDEIAQAAHSAQANQFIEKLPEQYETVLGQRGVNLSGGQKQRVAIARAIVRKPTILILDDSTSAVDVETESRIQQELAVLMHNRTSFVVAQRISTVLNADKILVLDDGQLVAEGKHADLITSSPLYRQIYESQLGESASVTTSTR